MLPHQAIARMPSHAAWHGQIRDCAPLTTSLLRLLAGTTINKERMPNAAGEVALGFLLFLHVAFGEGSPKLHGSWTWNS